MFSRREFLILGGLAAANLYTNAYASELPQPLSSDHPIEEYHSTNLPRNEQLENRLIGIVRDAHLDRLSTKWTRELSLEILKQFTTLVPTWTSELIRYGKPINLKIEGYHQPEPRHSYYFVGNFVRLKVSHQPAGMAIIENKQYPADQTIASLSSEYHTYYHSKYAERKEGFKQVRAEYLHLNTIHTDDLQRIEFSANKKLFGDITTNSISSQKDILDRVEIGKFVQRLINANKNNEEAYPDIRISGIIDKLSFMPRLMGYAIQ